MLLAPVIVIFFLSSVLIIHEAGHAIVAKLFGIRVIAVSIGLGPRLWAKRFGNTLYCLSLWPLGGYARILNAVDDDSEASDGTLARFHRYLAPVSEEEEKLIASATESENIHQRSFATQASVILGGVFFNLLSILLAGFVGYYKLIPIMELPKDMRVGVVNVGGPADKAGLRTGDIIEELNGIKIDDWQIFSIKVTHPGIKPVTLTLRRPGVVTPMTISYLPNEGRKTINGKDTTVYVNGFHAAFDRRDFTVTEAMGASLDFLNRLVTKICFGNDGPVTHGSTAADTASRSGLVSDALEVGYQASQSPIAFVTTFSALTLICVFLNLLPFPALDGGHFLLTLAEKIFRIPITFRVKRAIGSVGLFITTILTLLFLGKDLFETYF